MKRTLLFLTTVLISVVASSGAFAENRWSVYAGGSLSHKCDKAYWGNDKLNYGWGGGAFIGGGYEINFNSHWSLSPQLELSYNNNGAYLNIKDWDFYGNHWENKEFLTVNIPVVASFRFPLGESVGLRVGAGPYIQEALYGRQYKPQTNEKERMSGAFIRRFNVGVIGEVAVETGRHLSYMVRVQYPFLKEGWIKNTLILSAGIKYSF